MRLVNSFFSLLLFFTLFYSSTALAHITPQGKKLSHFLDSMHVESKWKAGEYIDWLSGRSLGEVDEGERVTHCSGFVAAATKKLGIYLLRPPQHDQALLANAQYHWLHHTGKKYGWFPIRGRLAAQRIANKGYLVVATYANPNPNRPGHIAIVRPSNKSSTSVLAHGPEIIQAGAQNFNSAPLNEGFSRHQTAFTKNRIQFYGHRTHFDHVV